jgi:hypothetical protein
MNVYAMLLAHLNRTQPQLNFRHLNLIPHPLDANVLTDFAQHDMHIEWKGRSYSIHRVHTGNSSISFQQEDGSTGAGFIQMIFKQNFDGQVKTFLVVSPHAPLEPNDRLLNPYNSMPGFLANVVYDRPVSPEHQSIIEPNQIVGHVAFYRRPEGTFGITRPIMVIVNSLHRNR